MTIPPHLADVIDRVHAKKLTYLKPRYLRDIAEAVIEADRARRPGAIIKAGAALAGSAIVMARSNAPEHKLNVYDAFGAQRLRVGQARPLALRQARVHALTLLVACETVLIQADHLSLSA